MFEKITLDGFTSTGGAKYEGYHKKYIRKRKNPKSQDVFCSLGCDHCNGTGYQGRIAIAECIQVDKKLKDLIHNSASENEISDYVFKDNHSIEQASVRLILDGVTSCEEIIRANNIKEDASI